MEISQKSIENNFSIQSIDITSSSVTFLNDGTVGTSLNQFNFSSGWNYEVLTVNDNYNSDDHWTTQVGASVTIQFTTTQFVVIATKDPGHGIMTISIDGGTATDIDLYSNVRMGKQQVFQSSVLSNTQHKVVLTCSGRKNPNATGIASFIDGIFILNSNTSNGVPAFGVLPTVQQVNAQKDELTAFLHFGVNTFTGNEWGTGQENPNIFNPTALNTDQWIQTLQNAGFKKAILTAKHHDGFCLWPSAYTTHDVASSSWMNGKGDVVKSVSQSCAKYGIKFGIYLSPWDENSPYYGTGDAYNQYYMNQLTELLTNYGIISEVWMDGAKGSNVQQDYNFTAWHALIKKLQPNCVIFSSVGPDLRWIGNEQGYAGDPCWSTVNLSKMGVAVDPNYLNVGEAGGTSWIFGESDVSIRPGWFYHASQDTQVKSLSQLMGIYFASVGSNSVLLLNVPPNMQGVFSQYDVARLGDFGTAISQTFSTNFALNKSVTVDSVYNNLSNFNGSNLTDGNYDTYWAPNSNATTGNFILDLGQMITFDVISLQEYIPLGQRVETFTVEAQQNGSWVQIFSGHTIGYKRLIRLAPITAQKIRVTITSSLAVPLINSIGVFKQPLNISLPSQPIGTQLLNDGTTGTGLNQFNFSSGWNYEILTANDNYNTDDHWTTQVGATVSIKFITNKFYVVATQDPGHGIMTISIDGGAPIDIDLYASSRTSKQIVFISGDLENAQHTILITCSGRKNVNSTGVAGFIDCIFINIANTLSFINDGSTGTDINQFNFSSGWNYETLTISDNYGTDDHWTTQIGATATINLTCTKFYVVSTIDPNHGIMSVSIDGGNAIDIDLYSPLRTGKQIVFESGDLSVGQHKIVLTCSGRKNTSANGVATFIDGIFILNNGGVGEFEIEQPQYYFDENVGIATFNVLRKGGTTGSISVDYGTYPGTAINGQNYQPWSGTLQFNDGVNKQSINLTIINTNNIVNQKYFTLQLSNNTGGSVLGINYQTYINLLPINVPTVPSNLNQIMSKLTSLTVNKGDTKLNLPLPPYGFNLAIMTTDYKTIINTQGNIYPPITSTTVTVTFNLSNNKGKNLTKDVPILVSGVYSTTLGANNKPNVIPNLREWIGGTGLFTPNKNSRIVIDKDFSDQLNIIGNKFVKDYQAITGNSISLVLDNPNVGDFYITLNCNDKGIGKEGYYIYINDYVRVEAISKPGAFFSTRTILQILQQNSNFMPKGIIRDYPKYESRGFMLDVGRKFSSLNFLQQYMEVMAWYKMNEFQIHLNDNYIWITESTWQTDYSAFRLECETFPGLTAKDGYYTKNDFKNLVNLAKEYGVNIISEIDSPGHSLAFTQYNPYLCLGVDHRDHLDVENPNVYSFINALFNEYLGGDDPVLGYNEFHIGTDEYTGTSQQLESFRGYTDLYLKKVRDEYGLVPRLWGSLGKISGKTPVTSKGVTMNIWNLGWADANAMINLGYNVINSIDSQLYIVPLAGYYRDYLDIQTLFNNWTANNFDSYSISSSHPQLRGGMFAIWNDMDGAKDKGICEFDIYNRALPATQVLGEKLWAGATERTYSQYTTIATAVSTIPNTNLTYNVISKTSTVLSYSFEDSNIQTISDISGNSYNGNGVNVTQVAGKVGKAIQLNGIGSYIQTPIDNIGPNYTVSMWINKNANGDFSEQILSESSISVLKACQKSTGNVGFSRQGIDYSFNYKLPENQWVSLSFVGILQETRLYVNGTLKDTINVNISGKSGTFVFPLTRIGSLNNSFKGLIDEFIVKNTI